MSYRTRLRGLLIAFLCLLGCHAPAADTWSYWSTVSIPNPTGFPAFGKMASDGTNIYFATLLDGVFRASLEDGQFTPMPMTGFPMWSQANTNGFALWNVGVSPQGRVLIGGSPINLTTNGISAPPSSFNNTLPVFYYWDDDSSKWQAAAVSNKSYPYTSSAGNFSVGPDGAVWTCSGFASYAYRSTDGGKSYTAFDINARVPAGYLPLPSGITTFGKVFSILVTPKNEVVVGTETGGFLHSTNNGLNWSSLDPNFTNTNSVNPLGRVGNASTLGLDRYGDVLCQNVEMVAFPALTNWSNVKAIAYHPTDGSYSKADYGVPDFHYLPQAITTPAGMTFSFMNQDYQHLGGIYRSADGAHWTQFNDGIFGLNVTFAPGITNAVIPGACITKVGNKVFVSDGGVQLWMFDSTPPPIVNRPPVAHAQNVNLWENTATNFTLGGQDADGDALGFSIATQPLHGLLSGTPPSMTYTPTNNFTGLDAFSFFAYDASSTSAAVIVNLAINPPTNTLSTISCVQPANNSWFLAPATFSLTAVASDAEGIRQVNFYAGSTFLGTASNAPYSLTVTNAETGDYWFSARAIDNKNARTWSAPVRVSVLPASPSLDVHPTDSESMAITWPLVLDGFFLEQAADVSGPWSLSPYAPSYLTNAQSVTMPASDSQFFRLMHP